MEEPDLYKSETKDGPYYSTLGRSTSRKSTPGRFSSSKSPSGRSTPGRSNSGRSTPGLSTSGRSTSAGRSTPGRSTPDRSMTPEAPPVPPATYHWEEVRKKRSVGGYPWTHLNKPPFDEKTFVKHQRDHVYEPVTPTASKDQLSSPTKQTAPSKTESRHFLRIPLTEEIVMADETGSEPEEEEEEEEEDDEEDEEEEEEEEKDNDNTEKSQSEKPQSDESIYEGENENSSVGETVDANNTRLKVFQQKVKVKADILRTKLQGVTKRKPKQKIVVDTPNSEKTSRRKFGQFATLPKKFTFNAPKVNFSTAFSNFTRNSTDVNESSTDDTKSGRFSLPRFSRFSRTSSESPKPSKSTKIGSSRLSIPGFRARTWSDASKVSKPDSCSDSATKPKLMDFSTYPRIFSKRRKTNAAAADKAKTPPPASHSSSFNGANDSGEPSKRKDSFRRRFFRSHKESTPAPTDEQTATLAVEEELDESHVSKESLAEFGDSDLQEVISLSDDCSRSKDTKSLSEHRPGVIEEIDSDEFFLREKGLSRGDVHISNYLSSEIRDVFRSNRTRSVEGVNNNKNNDNDGIRGGTATPVRPSRTNSLRRTGTRPQNTIDTNTINRFSTMPKSFGSSKPLKKPELEDYMPENIITSQTFEPSSSQNSVIPSTFRAPWRTAQKDDHVQQITHMPPKPPSRQRMSKFSTFDTRSMIDLSRKRSQSQIGFLPSMNFSETVPKAPLRRSRTSLAGSERDVSVTSDSRPSWSVCSGVPTPPLRRSRMSLTTDTDVDERSAAARRASAENGSSHVTAIKQNTMPPRPPPPSLTTAAGYATVDKSPSTSLLIPPQSPVRHRRKKSYEVIKSQEFGAFFTIPRSYSYSNSRKIDEESTVTKTTTTAGTSKLPPPSRPARAYNTLGPSRPHRRRLPLREHEYGDVPDDGSNGSTAAASSAATNSYEDGSNGSKRQSMTMTPRSLSLDEAGDGSTKGLFSGDVIEKMKLRPLPSPPPPPRKSKGAPNGTPESERRRNTDSALVPFLDQRETSVTSSDDFFADVSRALLASAAKNSVAADDVSIGIQTDPLPDGYELDDLGSCCSAESDRPMSRTSLSADRPTSRTSFAATATCSLGAAPSTDRPTSRTSMTTEYVDRPTSRVSSTAVENGYVMIPGAAAAIPSIMCAQRISVNELQVGKMIVADIRGQRMGVDDISGSSLKIAQIAAANGAMMPHSLENNAAAVMPPCDDDDQHHHNHQDDAMSVQSSRVSSMYPEVDSDEDRTSVLAVPTPPRRRSKPANNSTTRSSCSINKDGGGPVIDLSAAASDPSITELSCQLFRLCHSNVCSLFNKVVQQVVPEDTEKRRDLQAALCFLSIILAGLLILGFGNEKTIHHHHWDFQFPPPNQ